VFLVRPATILIAVFSGPVLVNPAPDGGRQVTEKVKGPASYFPSIEEKYGKPMDYWFEKLNEVETKTHMEQVAFLKAEHEMGHGHANAIVAYVKAKAVK
jgi:hypothetical protein